MSELKRLTADPPAQVRLVSHEQLDRWIVGIHGAAGTLYANECFALRFKFPDNYPLDAAEVVFVGIVP
ncbi:hypothetical protein H4R26_005873, partial [Coemansia thaxteri]